MKFMICIWAGGDGDDALMEKLLYCGKRRVAYKMSVNSKGKST